MYTDWSSSFSLFAIFMAVFYMLPSPLEPVVWMKQPPLPYLNGSWTPNTLLNETIKYYEREITAPESMAIDPANGNVYASLNDGTVVSITADRKVVYSVLSIGGFLRAPYSRNGLSETELIDWCRQQARDNRLYYNQSGETYCGRPLGIRFKIVSHRHCEIMFFS